MDESPVKAGDLLDHKYRVERVLGSGGMGVVVAAVHVDLGQRVALKFLLPQALQSGEAASRFIREARTAVKIESEHVARVLDVGRLENGAPYLVMEYLEGSDLSAHPRGEALAIEVAVDFVLQACAAMAVAHSMGIVHRDLKPANLFLTMRPDGSRLVKVLDFGISKMSLLDSPSVVTQASAFLGSPLYMSPEQAQSARTVDARTDIWSLGVILYELLTGQPPFPGETLTQVLTALMTSTPLPLRQLRPSVPAELEYAVLRALDKSVERRFGNIGEFSAALVEFAPPQSRLLHERVSGVLNRAGLSSVPPPPSLTERTRALSSAPVASGQAAATAGVSATEANWVAGKSAKARHRTPLLLVAALGLLLFSGLFLLSRSRFDVRSTAAGSALAPTPPVNAALSVREPSNPKVVVLEPAATPSAQPDSPSVSSRSAPHSAAIVRQRAQPAQASVASPAAPAANRKKNPLTIDFK